MVCHILQSPLNDEGAPLQQTWETWTRDSLCFRWGGWNARVFNNGIMKLPCMGRPLPEGWLQKASSKTIICLVSEFMTGFHPVRQQKPFALSHFGTGFCWDALVANRSKLNEGYVVLYRTKKLFFVHLRWIWNLKIKIIKKLKGNFAPKQPTIMGITGSFPKMSQEIQAFIS